MNCPHCGTPAEAGQRFCGECGTKLDWSALPPEPVYTEDERLKNDPVLNSAVPGPRPKKREKVPELTLEPELWSQSAAAAAAPEPEPAQPEPAAQAEAPAHRTEDFDYARPDAEYHGPAQGGQVHYTAPQSELPHDYTMAQNPDTQTRKLPNETLLLVWSLVLSCLFSVCGIVGLVKTIKARKTQDLSMKHKLLGSAQIWLIVGTILRLLPFVMDLL